MDAVFAIAHSPEWRERIVEEAERALGSPAETLAERLIETRAVIEEAVRLYPPLVAISRAAIEPDELAGRRIRRGAMVVIAPYVLHRHWLLWDRPDIFDPTRFLDGGRERIDRYAYLPFGAGPRSCIGSVFALQDATIMVATSARNFELQVPASYRVWPVHRVTLRPQGGLPMAVRSRIRSGGRRPTFS